MQSKVDPHDPIHKNQLYDLLSREEMPARDLLQEMAGYLAGQMNVERVSIWRFSRHHDQMRMVGAYQRLVIEPVTGMVVGSADFPEFLEAVQKRPTLVMDGVMTDSPMSELLGDCWMTYETRAAIFVPVHRIGCADGGVLYEHIGNERRWSEAEIKTAIQLSPPVGLALKCLEMEENERRVGAIQEIQTLFSSGGDFYSVLDILLEKCLFLTGADGARVFVKEPGSEVLRCLGAVGARQDSVGEIIPFGVGPVGETAETGRPLVVPAYASWPRAGQIGIEEGLHSFLCIPILWRGRTIGIVQVFTVDDIRMLGWDDLELLVPITQQIGAAVEEDRLLDISIRLTNLVDELHALGIAADAANDLSRLLETTLEIACRTMVVDVGICEMRGHVETLGYSRKSGKAVVELYDESGWEIDGATEVENWQFPPEDAASISSDMVRFELFSSVTVPLDIDDETRGVLILAMKQPRAWRIDEIEWVDNAGLLICAAAERILSEREVQRRSALLRLLDTAGENLARAQCFTEALKAVGGGIQALGKSYRGAILMHQMTGEIFIPWMNGLSRDKVTDIIANVRPVADRLFALSGPVMLASTSSSSREVRMRSALQAEDFQSIGLWPVLYDDHVLAVAACYYDVKPDLVDADYEVIEVFLRQAAAALENARYTEQLKHYAFHAALALSNTIGDFEYGTSDSTREMAEKARKIGKRLGLSDAGIEAIYWAALTHDIGKTAIPVQVLRKNGPLNEEEWMILRNVPVEGEKRLMLLPELKQAGRVVRHMRERFDGRGYPDGLSGQQIPLESRILAVVDAYQAMTTERPFRPVRTHEEAVSEIKCAAGSQFDPEVVEVFLELSERMPGAANRRN